MCSRKLLQSRKRTIFKDSGKVATTIGFALYSHLQIINGLQPSRWLLFDVSLAQQFTEAILRQILGFEGWKQTTNYSSIF